MRGRCSLPVGTSCNTAWEGLDSGIMGAEKRDVKSTGAGEGRERGSRGSFAGFVVRGCGTNGGLGGSWGYFHSKLCVRPAICSWKRPGSTTCLFAAFMNDKSSLSSSKV